MQGVTIAALPAEVLSQILNKLTTDQKAALRLVCKPLATSVLAQTSHASSKQLLTCKAADCLQQKCPQLTSISLTDCITGTPLHRLSSLQHVIFVPSTPYTGPSSATGVHGPMSKTTLDLGPLAQLPKLQSLHLEQVQLTQSPGHSLADLTQLQALHLVNCTGPSAGLLPQPLSFRTLPGLTRLRISYNASGGMARLHGLQDLQQVPLVMLSIIRAQMLAKRMSTLTCISLLAFMAYRHASMHYSIWEQMPICLWLQACHMHAQLSPDTVCLTGFCSCRWKSWSCAMLHTATAQLS